MPEPKHADVTKQIIGAFYVVYNSLGYGFLEKVYENALAFELRNLGLGVGQQKSITSITRDSPWANISRT
jgi:GxxExxY protein